MFSTPASNSGSLRCQRPRHHSGHIAMLFPLRSRGAQGRNVRGVVLTADRRHKRRLERQQAPVTVQDRTARTVTPHVRRSVLSLQPFTPTPERLPRLYWTLYVRQNRADSWRGSPRFSPLRNTYATFA